MSHVNVNYMNILSNRIVHGTCFQIENFKILLSNNIKPILTAIQLSIALLPDQSSRERVRVV